MSSYLDEPRYRDIDSGWAWVILCVSFMALVICGGALYSVSVFNVIFLEVFGESKALTSWIGSILIGLYALVGPLSSLLTARFGWRVTVVLGGLLATAGTLTSALATNIIHMFITFGFLTGFGHGLIYTPAIVVVGYYFDRRRTMASGIASVGAGIGMMVFPPAVTVLRSYFTWREIMVFIAGINLHICVLGALMRPLPLIQSEDDDTEGGYRTPSSTSRHSSRGTLYDLELQYLQIRRPSRNRYTLEEGDVTDSDNDVTSEVHGSGYLSQNLSLGSHNPSILKSESITTLTEVGQTEYGRNDPEDKIINHDQHKEANYVLRSKSIRSDNSLTGDIKQSKSSINFSPHSLGLPASHSINFSQQEDSKLDMGSIMKSKSLDKTSISTKTKPTAVRFKKESNTVCNWSLTILCISIFTAGIGLSTVYLHLSAFAIEHGATEHESSILISILGISSIASRIFTGLAGNDHTIDNVVLYIGTFGVAGMCTLVCPLIGWHYAGRILYAVSFGFYGSCFNVLLAPLTVELVGIDGLNMAFGIEMAVCGVAYLLGPPLAGQLYDMTQNYSTSFYLSGICLIVSAVVMLLVATTKKSRVKPDLRSLDRIGQA